MNFDLDTPIDRTHSRSVKVDAMPLMFGAGARDAVPLWVADMDFATCPAVVERLRERLADPAPFGYTVHGR